MIVTAKYLKLISSFSFATSEQQQNNCKPTTAFSRLFTSVKLQRSISQQQVVQQIFFGKYSKTFCTSQQYKI